MNKAEKQIAKANLTAEEKILKELRQVYTQAKKDCEERIKALNARTDLQNMQSIIYQKKYQEMLEGQIDRVLSVLSSKQYTSVEEYLNDSYANGWVGSMYSLQSQGIPLIIPIDEKKVHRALTVNSQLSKNYYKANPVKGRLAENVSKMKTSIRAELSRGVANGASWLEVGTKIATGMNNPFEIALRDTMRIVRTEGHRVNQQGFIDAGEEAQKHGADILKQWDATLDGRTRPDHKLADGQIREWDDTFDVGGEKLSAPSIGGSAKNVINCRCQLLQRARWALDEDELQTLKDRAEFFGLDKTADFEEYKKKFLKVTQNTITDQYGNLIDADTGEILVEAEPYFHDVSATTTKLKASVPDEADYIEFLDIVQSNGSVAPLYDLADEISGIAYKTDSGWYSPATNTLEYGWKNSTYVADGMSKYSTLAHEYGHYFDTRDYDGLTWDEYGGLRQILHQQRSKYVASASDQFLSAMRKDAMSIFFDLPSARTFCLDHRNTSTGVQDAIDGLGFGRIWWGHGDKYYNRFYNNNIKGGGWGYDYSKDVKEFYKKLGFDVSNQQKVKTVSRAYETASELWANIASAVTVGGEELESMRQYFPEAVNVFLEIIGKVVK